jgi:mono/diheme cytochrome c family protein
VRVRKWLIVALVVLAVPVACGAIVAILLVRSGLSARPEPSRLETALARTMRSLAGRSLRGLHNPVPDTTEVIAEGRAHFADHCSQCHANDGSGQTEMGRHLYPRAPDMRASTTQDLSDGELFGIIENGVRLTGMPAWGDGSEESHAESWKLVRFIRHLPHLTDQEKAAMERMNPKGPEEWREQQEEEQFLEGGQPSGSAPRRHH